MINQLESVNLDLTNTELDNNKTIVEDSSEDQDISPSRYSITSYGADYPVDGLVKRINRGDIFIPPFQRSYVWTIEKASRFIDSLLLGLPVPGIFLAKEKETNRLLVIDGQQRLKSLQFFYNGQGHFPARGQVPFRLCKVAPQFEGKAYEDLHPEDRRMLDDSIIPATIVRQESPQNELDPPSSIYYIFERLNTGGSKLLPQEIRSCIYHGKFNDFLGEINENVVWQRIFQGKESVEKPNEKNRLKDMELILRFFALFLDFDSYKGSMSDFLSGFMDKNRDHNLYDPAYLKKLFENTIEFIDQTLGIKAFRPRRGLNAAAFDAVMVGLARRLEQGEIKDLEQFKDVYYRLLESEEFRDVSINARQISSLDNVTRRINMATEAFGALP